MVRSVLTLVRFFKLHVLVCSSGIIRNNISFKISNFQCRLKEKDIFDCETLNNSDVSLTIFNIFLVIIIITDYHSYQNLDFI